MLVRFIKLGRCPAKDTKCEDLDFDKDDSSLPEINKTFSTLKVYDEDTPDEIIQQRATAILDREIEEWVRRGYALRCAPKTIDDEHHNWRRIARVGKLGKPSLCLQVVIDGIEAYFDPWIY